MNLVLLFDEDFIGPGRARLDGRRLQHVASVHRAALGDELVVGVAGGRIGRGRVVRLDDALELDVVLDADPPPSAGVALTKSSRKRRSKFIDHVILTPSEAKRKDLKIRWPWLREILRRLRGSG